MHKILHEEQPFTFLFNLYSLYFYRHQFRNVKFYVMGTTPYQLDEWFIPKNVPLAATPPMVTWAPAPNP